MGVAVTFLGRGRHHYATCRDPLCDRFGCRVYRQGFDAGYEAGASVSADAYADGYRDGRSDGYKAGAAPGRR